MLVCISVAQWHYIINVVNEMCKILGIKVFYVKNTNKHADDIEMLAKTNHVVKERI